MSIKVSIVEDFDAIRESLAQILDGTEGFRVGDACESCEEALRRLPNNPPDVVLMDINLPKQSGIHCVRELKRCLPKTQFVMLTIEEDSQRVFESLQAGATGYLVKNVAPERILDAIKEVHRGGSPISSQIARLLVQNFQQAAPAPECDVKLTARETEILNLLTRGFRSKEVAEQLRISFQTVNTHVRNIYEKLQVRSRAHAIARYLGQH